MFNREGKKMTIQALINKLREKGLIAYKSDDDIITIMYTYFNSEMEPFQEVIHFLVGENPADIYKEIIGWVSNKDRWVNDDKYLLLALPAHMKIDLNHELLKIGFKYADVELEDTNFVTVDCRYCYVDKEGNFRYDGILQLDNIGDAKITLEYIKIWINNFATYNPECVFITSKNK